MDNAVTGLKTGTYLYSRRIKNVNTTHNILRQIIKYNKNYVHVSTVATHRCNYALSYLYEYVLYLLLNNIFTIYCNLLLFLLCRLCIIVMERLYLQIKHATKIMNNYDFSYVFTIYIYIRIYSFHNNNNDIIIIYLFPFRILSNTE